MFRHRGKIRTYSHNLKLASILSCVAGIVNITGGMSLNTLTTNVTGHFAYFSEELFSKNYAIAIVYLCYIIFFLLGAFTSSLLMEWISNYKYTYRYHVFYVVPIFIEVFILSFVGFSDYLLPHGHIAFPILLSCTLLFSMGLQNALVTRVSQSVVRTTHLTGLFTDLGIELSQLFFYKEKMERTELRNNIFLKLAIIGSFFLGGIVGGFVYMQYELRVLILPVALLLLAIWYDRMLFQYYFLKRKLRHRRRLSKKDYAS